MRSWNDYKNTFDSSENIFSLARSGNTLNLKNFLDSNHGVDINKKNHKGYSSLMLAVYNGNYEASAILLENGADPNSSDFSGNTVLMGAAFKGNVDMVRLLIQRGALTDTTNQNGLTAEQWASAFGRTDVISILKPKAKHSRIQNMMNAVKVVWGFLKPNTRKEAIA
jgi:ankyrin repeat protein